MSDPNGGTGTIDVADLWHVLQDLEDGTLAPEKRDELMSLLDRSPAARRAYLEYFEQTAILEAEGETQAELGTLPVLEPSLRYRRVFRRSVMAAAALLLVSAVVATLIAIKQPEPAVLSAAMAADTRWMVDGESQEAGVDEFEVVEGSVVRVFSGTIRLGVESGAAMVVQGPAEVSFPTLTHPVLRKGWLWIDAEAADEPFEVETPGLLVRDIGTRFGVRVAEDGAAEIHVVEGAVEVETKGASRPPLTLKPGASGVSVTGSGAWEDVALARDPFPGLPDLLAAGADYPTTVLAQSPVGYWRLEDEFLGEVVNAVPEGSVGLHSVELQPGEPGVAEGFHGFDPDNQAIRLDGESVRSVLYNIDGPAGVAKEEGAVAFWIRRLPDEGRPEMLWYAGEEGSEVSGSPDMMFVHLTPTGGVGFFMENGRYDVLLASTRAVADGRWHHVVASWGSTAVALFVDGRQVARDAEFRASRDGVFFGRDIRFGKVGSAGHKVGLPLKPFTGWVDEVALWNRPLTAPEVRHQYQAARGVEGK